MIHLRVLLERLHSPLSHRYINIGILTGMAIARRESRLNNVDARDSAAILALKVSFSSKDIERPFARSVVVKEECKAWLPGIVCLDGSSDNSGGRKVSNNCGLSKTLLAVGVA